jgi:hypothetical protein
VCYEELSNIYFKSEVKTDTRTPVREKEVMDVTGEAASHGFHPQGTDAA